MQEQLLGRENGVLREVSSFHQGCPREGYHLESTLLPPGVSWRGVSLRERYPPSTSSVLGFYCIPLCPSTTALSEDSIPLAFSAIPV